MRRLAPIVFAALIMLMSGCGFQLRGQSALPFESAFVDAGATSQIAAQLRRSLSANDKLANSKDTAGIVIRLAGETREKNILSLSGTGKVREYRLIHRVTLSAMDRDKRNVLAPSTIQLNRDFSYDDQQIMAKEAEESMLHKEMEQDILRQILRRLGYIKTQ